MLIIPVQALPSQTVQVTLSGQAVQLNIYQKSTGMFMDVYSNGNLVIAGVICQNLNLIVRSTYFGFLGDFYFIDMTDSSDPVYTGLGDQYQLAYLEPSDVAAANFPPGVS